MKNKLAIHVLIIMIVILITTINCNAEDTTFENNGYDDFQWIAPGLDVGDIPFDFVFPTYLPAGIDTRPLLKGHFPRSNMESIAEVTVDYYSIDSDPSFNISIMETNNPNMILPEADVDYGFTGFTLANVDIVESVSDMQMFAPDGSTWFERGLEFDWIQNELYFSVTIHGYERSECLKVIESIIQQG